MVDRQGKFTPVSEETDISLRNILIVSLVITVFVDVFLFYYGMIHAERRSNIIRNGQMTAMKSADQLSHYLSASIDTVKLTAYTLEEMQARGGSFGEILDFLTWQSTAVTTAVFENTTGMYAYIDGEFLDGTLMDPGEDFVATKRPWYIKAMEGDGDVAIVDPYLDVHTGTVMMTVAKRLSDGSSVLGMDVSMGKIQQIVENAMTSGDSDVEIILDSHDIVVAHSNPGEIGMDYSREQGTIWARLAKKIRADGDNFLEVDYEDAHYIIYAARTEGNWLCLSVKNTVEAFRPLRQLAGLTVLVVLFVILVLACIMTESHQRYWTAQKLNRELLSISNIYMAMYDVDIGRNRVAEIKSPSEILSRIVRGKRADARAMVKAMTRVVADPSSLEDVLRFVDLDTLDERLRREETVATEFLTVLGPWMRLRFIVSQRDEEGSLAHVLLVVEDIDKEKRERDELVDMSQRALAANEAKSAFLSNMSHEIRTPINAVLGMNEMILREGTDDNILVYAERIKAAGNTLLGIINDVLDFSKIEAGKLEIIPVEYDLSSVLNDLVNMVQTRADDKGLVLTLNFDRDTPKRLYGDEVRVKQVITNILTNAVKYTEKGTVTFSVGFEPAGEDRVALLVAVRDTGIGIRPEDRKKLFAEFERIEEKRNRNVEGTGLGLAITRNLLNMMGTVLEVESVYGQGSIFHFRLEQKVVEWEPLGDYAAAYHVLLKERNAGRALFTAPEAMVLVVDDNPMNLTVFKSLLKRTKIQVDTAGGGDEGLSLLGDRKYDLIFLDHMMPHKDGIETLHELRAQIGGPNAATPAICLTANAISGAREQYLAAGFDDYLTKPIDPALLEDMLRAYLPPEKITAAPAGEADGNNAAAKASETLKILAPLRGQDWIDLTIGIQNSGDAAAYPPLLKLFHESLPDIADEIDGYYAAEDWKNYTIKVHALKSSARIIGAMAFGEEAQLLENAGKGGDIGYIRAHHADFLAKYRSFAAPLAAVFPETEAAEDKPEADPERMRGVYEEIRTAAEEMDADRLEEIFAEMEAYRVPAPEAERYEKMRHATDRLEYEAILALLPENE